MSPAAEAPSPVDIVVVTGMSGSGRSTAIAALEDEGYYCIDNLPTALVPRFVELCASAENRMARRSRSGSTCATSSYVERWPQVRDVHRGRRSSPHHRIPRRSDDAHCCAASPRPEASHPLGRGRDLAEAIRAERQAARAAQGASAAS